MPVHRDPESGDVLYTWTTGESIKQLLAVEDELLRSEGIGKTALRIPADEVKRVLDSFVDPHEQPHHLYRRVRDFEVRTGRTPADFAAAWREGKIEDTPQNAREEIEALALHRADQWLCVASESIGEALARARLGELALVCRGREQRLPAFGVAGRLA